MPQYGMNAHLAGPDVLERIASAGFQSVRIDANWYMLQPERERFNWDVMDTCVEAAHRLGLQILACLSHAPPWANGGREHAVPPLNPQDWYWFVHRTVMRYREQIKAWGMWNEPNMKGFWTGSPEQYVNLIIDPGARAVKDADPTALVCGPDLAMEGQWWKLSQSWNHWLLKILDLGDQWLDVVTVHNYQDTGDEVLRRIIGPTMPWESLTVREVMARSGQGHKPLWLTETGIDSRQVGEEKQAAFYTEIFSHMDAEGIDRLMLFQAIDEPQTGMGILREDLSLKPAYHICRMHLGTDARAV